MSGGWQDWLALSLAVAFTAGCVLLAWLQSGGDLEAAQHELVLDELWLDGDDWLEAA